MHLRNCSILSNSAKRQKFFSCLTLKGHQFLSSWQINSLSYHVYYWSVVAPVGAGLIAGTDLNKDGWILDQVHHALLKNVFFNIFPSTKLVFPLYAMFIIVLVFVPMVFWHRWHIFGDIELKVCICCQIPSNSKFL